MINIGFTGTRRGLTRDQGVSLAYVMGGIESFAWWTGNGWTGVTLHHGDCVGADEMADRLARERGWTVEIHPPEDPKHRAWCGQPGDTVHGVAPYLDRNIEIVRATGQLIACPGEMHEVTRSGTWHTIRAAARVGRRITLVWPDGTVGVGEPT